MSGNVINHRGGRVLCSRVCPINHIETGLGRIKEPPGGWPDIRGLHSLNSSRNTWLTGDAIEVSIQAYARGLPPALQNKIGLGMLGLHPSIWSRPGYNNHQEGRDRLSFAIASPPRRLVRRLKANEYSIFPVCCEFNTLAAHWVLVILHKNEVRSRDDPSKMEWSRVVQAAVVDPFRDSKRVDFVHSTLHQWMTAGAGFTFAPNYKATVWVPMQHDATSCGPRAYWHAKQILDRLLAFHEDGINYDASLWNDLSGWMDEDFVRGEMTGRCAVEAVRAMNYKARVSVEIVNMVKAFGEKNASWVDAAQMMRPKDLTGARPQVRPNKPQVTQVPSPDAEPMETSSPPKAAPSTPPAPVPNQHEVAPGASPSKQKNTKASPPKATTSNNTSSVGPTFPTTGPPKNLMVPPWATQTVNPNPGDVIDLVTPSSSPEKKETESTNSGPKGTGTTKITPTIDLIDLTSPTKKAVPPGNVVMPPKLKGIGFTVKPPVAPKPGSLLASGTKDVPTVLGTAKPQPPKFGVPSLKGAGAASTTQAQNQGKAQGSSQTTAQGKTSPSKRVAADDLADISPSKRLKTEPAPKAPPKKPTGGAGAGTKKKPPVKPKAGASKPAPKAGAGAKAAPKAGAGAKAAPKAGAGAKAAPKAGTNKKPGGTKKPAPKAGTNKKPGAANKPAPKGGPKGAPGAGKKTTK